MKKLLILILVLISCRKDFEVPKPEAKIINEEMAAITDRFKYYLDLGTGYQEIDIYDNELEFSAYKEADISYRLKAEEIQGQCTFKGDLASQVYAKRTSGYYLPFKVTNTYDATENTLIECNLDVRGEYDPKTETLDIKSFVKAGQIHDKLIAGYDVKYNVLEFSPALTTYSLTNEVTSKNLEIFNYIPTSYSSWTTFKSNHNVYGDYTGSGDSYDRWDYTFLVSTVDIGGGNYVFTWQMMYFDFMPGTEGSTNGYIEVPWPTAKGSRWIKAPTVTDETETFDADYTENAYKLDEILDYIIQGLDSDLELIAYSAINPTLARAKLNSTYVCNTSEFNGAIIDNVEFSLKDIFDFIKNYYGGEWYIDAGEVTFDDYPYEHSDAIIDWSDEISIRTIEDAYDPMPDKEIWAMADSNLDTLQISYFDKGVVTDGNTFDYSVDYYHDLAYLKENGADNNLIVLTTATSSLKLASSTMFALVVKHALYTENTADGIFFIEPDPYDDYLKITADVDNRPLWKTTHEKTILDYTTFNIFSKISGMGYLDNYKVNLRTGVGTFTCFGESTDIN